MGITRKIGVGLLWALQIFAAFGFVAAGQGKFHNAFWITSFARWGYADWFRDLIGVLEVLGGLALLVPRTAFYGATVIATIMVGAAATLLLNGEGSRAFAPVFWLGVVTLVACVRYRRAWRPVSGGAIVPARQV
jgi:putative oxidoreductase